MALDGKNNKNLDTSNIFEELGNNSSLNKEVDKLVSAKKKDVYYYLNKIGYFLQIIVGFSLLGLVIVYSYIYIQENEDFSNSSFIDPICYLFLGDIKNTDTYCSSISSVNKDYLVKLEELKQDQVFDINSIIEALYKLESYNISKDVIFLRTKSETKLPTVKILEDFDTLKNEFESIEKEKIKCFNIEISSDYVFKATCNAFSSGFDKEIKGFDGTDSSLVSGKSISYANSFLNFIEKQSNNFVHINKQNIFNEENLLGKQTGFTNKTQFLLELQYKTNNLF